MSNLITQRNYGSFKLAYNKAVKANKTEYIWKGVEVATSYAKYVVEYVEGLKKEKK